MCTSAPFLTWNDIKKNFPSRIKIDNDKESIRYGAKYLVTLKFLFDLRSPYYGGFVWQPGERHYSSRIIQFASKELQPFEMNKGKVNFGFHSYLSYLDDANYGRDWYRKLLNLQYGNDCFVGRVYRDEFVCGGLDNSSHTRLSVVSTHLTIGTISQAYRNKNFIKLQWRQAGNDYVCKLLVCQRLKVEDRRA